MNKFKNYMNNLLVFYADYFDMYIMHKILKGLLCEN